MGANEKLDATFSGRTIKHSTLFELFVPLDRGPVEDKVVFRQVAEEGEDVHALVMKGNTFRELGEPEIITVTIRPGDLLNAAQPDNASER
jgi:hypothetical protein